MAAARPAASRSGTSRPFSPSVMTDAMPPAGVATTGVPEASASRTTLGSPSTLPASSRMEGTTATSAAASASGTDWWASRPGKRT